MRKISLLLTTFMLIAASITVDVQASELPDYIRIGLKHGNSAPYECLVTSASGFSLGTVKGEDFVESLPLPGYKELVAEVEDGHVALKDKSGVMISADIGIDGCLMPYDAGINNLSVDGESYRGGVIIKGSADGKLTVINYLPLEEYLYGVVHREMGMGNPIEALKAQAITARTFAVLNKDRHASSGFDLCQGTHCQVYGGCKDEYESTNKAVDETKGMIIYCKGVPAEIYYYKNSGGNTQNSEDVWSEKKLHLRGIPDPYSPDYPWTAVIGFKALRQKLILAGMDPGDVISVRIGGYNSSGAVSSLIVLGKEKEVVLEKSKIRDTLGASLVRSTHFSIEGDPDDGNCLVNLISHDKKHIASVSDHVFLIGGDGRVAKKEINGLEVSNGTENIKISFQVKDGGDPLTLSGLGYGHGVGMAQDGAIQMAKQGMSYMDILNFYYTDIEVY